MTQKKGNKDIPLPDKSPGYTPMVKNGKRSSLMDREIEAAAALEEPSKEDGVDIELLRRQDNLRRTLTLSNS